VVGLLLLLLLMLVAALVCRHSVEVFTRKIQHSAAEQAKLSAASC
jgi:hypothetical protein